MFILQLLSSIVFGFLIGLERETHKKSIGIRTTTLITLGSTLFTLMSPTMFNGDNSRIIAQIVSGISFLCIGVIIKDDGNHIKGLTTASTVWCSAAIGCLCGIGWYLEAFLGTVIIVGINYTFKYFKNLIK